MTNLDTAVLHHLHHLAGEIGSRPMGSPPNDRAAAYIASVLASSGFAVERQEYACPTWSLEKALLEQNGAPIVATANPYSPSCELTAPVVAAATLAELNEADCSGRICIIHGDLTRREQLDPPYAIYLSEPDPVATALLAKRPMAVIAVSPTRCEPEVVFCDWEFPIPSVTVDCETGRKLLQNATSPVHLTIQSTRSPSATANIVGTLPGKHNSRRLVLCAHFDTGYGGPGALDNASGTAVLLGVAESLSGALPESSLEFIFFSGEEAGGVDITEYFRHVASVDDVIAAINVDGVGSWVGATGVVAMASSPALEAAVAETMRAFPGVVLMDPWYESDHSGFTMRGVPSIPLTASGCPRLLHGTRDTEDIIDPARLGQTAHFVEKLAESLQSKTPAWARPTA